MNLLFILFLLAFHGNANANTWWVDDDASGPNHTGTQSDPFPHPGWANSCLGIGDTVNILDGLYICDPELQREYIRIRLPGSSSNSDLTLYRAYIQNEGDTVFIRMKDFAFGQCFEVADSTYNVIIEGFYMYNATGDSGTSGNPWPEHCCGVLTEGNGTIVRNNHIYGCNMGVFIRSPNESNPTEGHNICGNIISDCGEAGIRVKGAKNCRIMSNILYGNAEWHAPSGGIVMYRTSNTMVYNNTVIVEGLGPSIHLYRGTNPNSNPCRNCEISDNIGITVVEGNSTIFAVDSTMADITSNKFHHNTWWDAAENDTTWFAFGLSSWHFKPMIPFEQYLDSLPDNGINGIGEANRDPYVLNDTMAIYPFLLDDAVTSEKDAGSRTASQANLGRLTALVSQTLDADTVDRGYHQNQNNRSLNPSYVLPSGSEESNASHQGKHINTGIGPKTQIQADEVICMAVLYNVLGQQVAVLKSREVSRLIAETYTLNLPTGIYLLHLETLTGPRLLKIPVRH